TAAPVSPGLDRAGGEPRARHAMPTGRRWPGHSPPSRKVQHSSRLRRPAAPGAGAHHRAATGKIARTGTRTLAHVPTRPGYHTPRTRLLDAIRKFRHLRLLCVVKSWLSAELASTT